MTIIWLIISLDSNMNMQQDVVNTCRSSYMHIRKINSIRKYLSKESTLTLVNATVLMRLDYCNSLLCPQKVTGPSIFYNIY